MQKGEAFNIQTQKRSRLGSDDLYIVCTPSPPFCRGGVGGWGLSLQPNFQNGGAWQDLDFYMGVAEKKGGDFFQGGLQFSHKK